MLGDGDADVKAEPHQTGIQDHWLSLRSEALQVFSTLISKALALRKAFSHRPEG
jgi:hypothetical protein